MDTRVNEGQKRLRQPWFARAYASHLDPFCWCAMLCMLVCGCDLVEPAPQTAEPAAPTRAAQSTNQVAAPPPPRVAAPHMAATAAPSNSAPTPQPPAARTAIVDPPPAPALSPALPTQPAKSAQNAVVPAASANVQTRRVVTNPVANPPPVPQTTVAYMPREAAAAIVIKGPPRQPKPSWTRSALPLCLGMGLGAGLVALVLGARRRAKAPALRKVRNDGLFLPSEFKFRDSNIETEISAPLGMLAPEKPVRRSKVEVLASVLASMANAVRFLASKIPKEQIGTAWRVSWQRMSAPFQQISPESASGPPSPGAPDSKSGESPAAVASQHTPQQNGVQSKPAEKGLPDRPAEDSSQSKPTEKVVQNEPADNGVQSKPEKGEKDKPAENIAQGKSPENAAAAKPPENLEKDKPAESITHDKPAERGPSPPSSNPGLPANAPAKKPTLEPATAAKAADEAVSAPKKPCREAPVLVS